MPGPKIVVLDGHALNPGDLSWSSLESLGQLTVYERTKPDELVSRARDAEVLVTNKTKLSAQVLEQLPALRFICVLATGYDVVDVVAARARGIPVSNVPAYGTHSVAQHTFALLLELTSKVGKSAESVKTGRWSKTPDWCYWDQPLTELHGLTLAIVGSGRIGSAVGKIAEGFGMNVIHFTSKMSRRDFEASLPNCDVVSLHCPLNHNTRMIINSETLALMKKSVFIINTSRGGLIDEHALAASLNAGSIAGAGLDVLSDEPPAERNPLISAQNCLITPHQAWATVAARNRLMKTAGINVASFINGNQQNVVN